MHTRHSTLLLAGHLLQRIDFDPASFQPADLLWLPHHALLAAGGRKRQTEHLAGRIAAVHALREVGEKMPPPPGEQRQPLWPAPWFGSISHCENSALAVVSSYPIGIDIERCLTPALAAELESSIINAAEKPLLAASGLPFALALTLAFSAKESGFKAWSTYATDLPGFHSAQIIAMDADTLHLRFNAAFSAILENITIRINWLIIPPYIITCTRYR
ncbi:TPA: enterobactin synthase subunit EntD [Raoultella terrigena]|uniref:Enterobactin synthase component D n=1 Tax=Raoultella terrigena TaxID=577 RepID=A0AAP9XNP2_RAOTE|nr:enterobactin synthase subunit EntD [Raoultella terrigena]QPF07560.1 enterobactin synthase subunit EntD [Raoultella terrigena]